MITLFKEITTEEVLQGLEAESEKWDGLYCDLEADEERKFVKEKAASIKTLLKKVNTARIAKTKDYRFQVETEAKLITARLEAANKPFTLLLDEYQIKRNKILAAKKAQEEAEELAAEVERCHDEAFTIDKLMVLEAKEREQAKIEEAARVKKELEAIKFRAAEDATIAEAQRQEEEAKKADIERRVAESNKQLRASIHKGIKENLMADCNIDEETAIKVVKSLIIQSRVTIHYL